MIEHAVIDKLLSVDFPGSEQLRAQLLHTAVVGVCDCGCATVSLRVDTSATVAAPVISSAPVSADISVGDQYAGVVLLVDNGYLSYLEVYSIGEPVRALPPLEEIHPSPAR
ncbi:MAG: hypothetical protein WA890_29935 [Micromonospora sp.]